MMNTEYNSFGYKETPQGTFNQYCTDGDGFSG